MIFYLVLPIYHVQETVSKFNSSNIIISHCQGTGTGYDFPEFSGAESVTRSPPKYWQELSLLWGSMGRILFQVHASAWFSSCDLWGEEAPSIPSHPSHEAAGFHHVDKSESKEGWARGTPESSVTTSQMIFPSYLSRSVWWMQVARAAHTEGEFVT